MKIKHDMVKYPKGIKVRMLDQNGVPLGEPYDRKLMSGEEVSLAVWKERKLLIEELDSE